MHKLTIIFLITLASFSFQSTASESTEAACAMFMCAYGDGEKSNEDGGCSKHMKALKKIQKVTRGYFLCNATKAQRLAQLMLCKKAPKDLIKKTIKMLGCIR